MNSLTRRNADRASPHNALMSASTSAGARATDPRVNEWVESNLHYVAEAKLAKLSIDDLTELHGRMMQKLNREAPVPNTSAVLIKEILEMKKQRSLKPTLSSPLASPVADVAKLNDTPPKPKAKPAAQKPQPTEKTAQPAEETHSKPNTNPKPKSKPTAQTPTEEHATELFLHPEDVTPKDNFVIVQKHGIRICSFNALKLRTERAGLADQWLALSAVFASFDVILMQEVPAPTGKRDSEFEQRVTAFADLLQKHTDKSRSWSMLESRPSSSFDATGKQTGNWEVHTCFVKSPVEFVDQKWTTMENINNVKMDYAPFSVLLKDPRFLDPGEGLFLVTSVHFPPTQRSEARDTQLKAILKGYPTNSTARLNTPFTSKGAADARRAKPMHIICGDFNVFPDDAVYELTKNGWAPPLLGEEISTSSGRRSYDNFIIDVESQRRFQFCAEVLQLAMPQRSVKGEIGLSDHNPIVLVVRDAQNTKHRASKEKAA